MIIRTGITRHIIAIRGQINDKISELDAYTKSKLIEWALRSDVCEMPVLGQLRGGIMSMKNWVDKRNFFTSQVHKREVPLYEIDSSTIPKVLARMDACVLSLQKTKTHKDVVLLLRELCKELDIQLNKKKTEDNFHT